MDGRDRDATLALAHPAQLLRPARAATAQYNTHQHPAPTEGHPSATAPSSTALIASPGLSSPAALLSPGPKAMVESAPSTPSGPRVTPGGGRHLKRLSLSSSFSPNGHSPLSANPPGATATSPLSSRTTPTSVHRGDSGVRALRTTVNGAFPPSSSPSARRLDPDPSSSTGSGTPSSLSAAGPLVDAHRLAGPADDPRSSSPTILRRSTSYRTSSAPAEPGTAAASPSAVAEGTASLGRSHSRRGASVSYTGRSSLDGLALSGLGSSPARSSVDGPPSATEHALSRSRGPSSSLQGVPETGSAASSASASSSGPATGPAVGEPAAQPTLVEQNADLLSFIAKKERKCLDLREGASRSLLLRPRPLSSPSS